MACAGKGKASTITKPAEKPLDLREPAQAFHIAWSDGRSGAGTETFYQRADVDGAGALSLLPFDVKLALDEPSPDAEAGEVTAAQGPSAPLTEGGTGGRVVADEDGEPRVTLTADEQTNRILPTP